MDFDLRKASKEKILLVAHRGSCGGNIPCNTITSYETALKQGADMIEIDVTRSSDGELFVFHPRMEPVFLRSQKLITEMTRDEVLSMPLYNQDMTATQFRVSTLDEVLDRFKGRCFINCDKFWDYPKEISDCIRRHGMMEQILVKTGPKKELFDIIETYAPDVQYMVIVREDAAAIHEELLHRNINYMGQEILFTDDTSLVCSEEYLARLRRDNILSWVNSIIYNHKTQLAGGHSDDTALSEDMEKGWGWLARRGFDFIQTDWVMMLKGYLEQNHLLYRK